jgi:hypothetical protein
MQVKTSSDLWYFVSQKEYQPHLRFVASMAEAVERMGHSLELWLGDLSAIGLIGGMVGLFAGMFGTAQRRLFLALALSALSTMIFPLWYIDPDSMFIPLVIILAVGAGVLVNESMIRWRATPWAAGALLAGVVALLAPGNFRFVRSLTYNPSSQNLIDAAAAIPTPCPTILSHWGWDLKAYQYGQIVTGQLTCARIVTLDDDLRKLLKDEQDLHVSAHFFYQMSQDEFRQRVGSIHMNSAGLGMVKISKRIQTSPPQDLAGQPTPMGSDMTLLGYRIKRSSNGVFDVTLFWQAQDKPAGDYSVFVRLSDKNEISAPGDITAQVDSQAPVYGWYPTSQWQTDEVVREDYGLTVPPGKSLRLLAIGLYTREASGAFYNLGVANFPLSGSD